MEPKRRGIKQLPTIGDPFSSSSHKIVFAIMPLFALGGIVTPALQALATRQVDVNRQGQFQGVLGSAISLASIVAPLGFSVIYYLVQQSWPGAIWLSVVGVYALAVPLIILGTRKTSSAESAPVAE